MSDQKVNPVVDNIPHVITAIEKQRQAISLCLENRLIVQGVMLIYAGIDNLAFLCIANGPDVSRNDFCAFIEKFFDPQNSLECTALELYGARCGALHSYSAESNLFRQRKVRVLTYSWGTADPAMANRVFSSDGWEYMHCLSVESLQRCYDESLLRIASLAESDASFHRRLNERGHKFLSHLPSETLRAYVATRSSQS